MRRFSVSPFSIVVFPLYVYFCGAKTFLVFMLAALIHELGHVTAILFSHGRIECVRLGVGGLEIKRSAGGGYLADSIVSISGPMLGLFSSLIAFYLDWDLFFSVSLAYSIFNLLPVIPLDGGVFLRSVLLLNFEYPLADCLSRFIGTVVLIVVFVFGVILLLYTEWNASMLIVFLCIFISSVMKEKV